MSSFQKKKKLWGLQKQGSVTHIWAEKRKYLVKTEYDEVQRQNVADKNFRATENTQIMQTLFKEFPGERNGNPLWYSCLETPRDRGA